MNKVDLTASRIARLKPALWGNATPEITKEIKLGVSELYESRESELLIVTRLECREFVVVAAQGRNLHQYVHQIIGIAKAKFAQTIRWHTKHPAHLVKGVRGLRISLNEKRLTPLGENEYIYKLKVNDAVD